jgi:acylphosphatase
MMSVKSCEWQIRIEGRVQGVGFRAATRKQATLYQITGYVRNCSDGSVEICAQGKEKDLDAFLEGIRTRSGVGSIKECRVDRHHPKERYSSFEIR